MMKNIVFTIHNYSGAQTYANQLKTYLSTKKDVNLYIIYLGDPSYKEFTVFKDTEYNLVSFYFPPSGKRNFEIYSKRAVDLLSIWLKSSENIILHLNSPYQNWFCHYFKLKFNAKVVYTLHFLLSKYTEYHLKNNDIEQFNDINGAKEIIEGCDRLICVTSFAKEMINKYYKSSYDKTHLIYNGCNIGICKQLKSSQSKVELRTKYGFGEKDVILLYVGRIDDSKGCDVLIKSVLNLIHKVNNLKLVVVGGGNYKMCLNQVGLNCSKILFTGYLDSNTLGDLYKIVDIGIIPSLWEQCSYVALEMMSYRLPVIYSDVPGLNEIFGDSELNVKIAVNVDKSKHNLKINLESLEGAILKLACDENLRLRLANNMYKIWESRFKTEIMGELVYDLYDSISLESKQIRNGR